MFAPQGYTDFVSATKTGWLMMIAPPVGPHGELQFALGQTPFSAWNTYVATLKAQVLDEWVAQATAVAKRGG